MDIANTLLQISNACDMLIVQRLQTADVRCEVVGV